MQAAITVHAEATGRSWHEVEATLKRYVRHPDEGDGSWPGLYETALPARCGRGGPRKCGDRTF